MKFTNNIAKNIVAMAVAAFALTSCITENTVPNTEREKVSLKAWIQLNKPELIDN